MIVNTTGEVVKSGATLIKVTSCALNGTYIGKVV